MGAGIHPVHKVTSTAKWLVALPEPSEHGSGPFLLFDKKGQPAGISTSYDDAIKSLHEKFNMGGTIFRADDLTDVSPQVRFRSKFGQVFHHQPWAQYPDLKGGGSGDNEKGLPGQQSQPAPSEGRMDGDDVRVVQTISGINRGTWVRKVPNLDLVPDFIEQLNRIPLAVIDRHNQKNPRRMKTVKITETVKEEKVRHVVETEDVPTTITLTSREEVPYPTSDWEPRGVNGFGEVTRVVPRWQLCLPSEYWAPKVLQREAVVEGYFETRSYPMETVERKPVERLIPYIEEKRVTREVQVPDDTQGQLLYILTDWSPSTFEDKVDCDSRRLPLEVAIASVVVGCHLRDGSRYFYRPFTEFVGKRIDGEDEVGKLQLIAQFLVPQGLGGGTDFVRPVVQAAEEIRGLRDSQDEIPEILLLTDGNNTVDSGNIADIVGGDIILHTVMVHSSNTSLRMCSKTYTELWLDKNNRIEAIES